MSILQMVMASVVGSGGLPPPPPPPPQPIFKNWTIEWWHKKLSPQTNSVPRVFAVGVDTAASIGYSNESGGDYVWTGAAANGPFTVGSIVNQWHNFSINSDGSNLYVFMDGVLKFSAARTGNKILNAETAFLLGGDTSNFWKGRVTDFHIVKGACKYTSPYSTPTGRITPQTETVLYLPFTSNSLNSAVGPNADTITGATWNADDPWTDPGTGSVAFTGANSFLQWNGNSIFALDS